MASKTLSTIVLISFIMISLLVQPRQAQLPFPLPPFPFPLPPIGPNPRPPGISNQCISAITNLGTCLPEIFRAFTTRSPLSAGCCQKVSNVRKSCLPAGVPTVDPFFSFLCKATPPTPMSPPVTPPSTI